MQTYICRGHLPAGTGDCASTSLHFNVTFTHVKPTTASPPAQQWAGSVHPAIRHAWHAHSTEDAEAVYCAYPIIKHIRVGPRTEDAADTGVGCGSATSGRPISSSRVVDSGTGSMEGEVWLGRLHFLGHRLSKATAGLAILSSARKMLSGRQRTQLGGGPPAWNALEQPGGGSEANGSWHCLGLMQSRQASMLLAVSRPCEPDDVSPKQSHSHRRECLGLSVSGHDDQQSQDIWPRQHEPTRSRVPQACLQESRDWWSVSAAGGLGRSACTRHQAGIAHASI